MQGFMTAKSRQPDMLVESFDHSDLSALLIRLLL